MPKPTCFPSFFVEKFTVQKCIAKMEKLSVLLSQLSKKDLESLSIGEPTKSAKIYRDKQEECKEYIAETAGKSIENFIDLLIEARSFIRKKGNYHFAHLIQIGLKNVVGEEELKALESKKLKKSDITLIELFNDINDTFDVKEGYKNLSEHMEDFKEFSEETGLGLQPIPSLIAVNENVTYFHGIKQSANELEKWNEGNGQLKVFQRERSKRNLNTLKTLVKDNYEDKLNQSVKYCIEAITSTSKTQEETTETSSFTSSK